MNEDLRLFLCTFMRVTACEEKCFLFKHECSDLSRESSFVFPVVDEIKAEQDQLR